MADKLRTQQELERLQAKFIGTGHPDTTSWEWRTNIQRDTYASIVGHPPLLSYMSLAENEPASKTRAKLIRVSNNDITTTEDTNSAIENATAKWPSSPKRRLDTWRCQMARQGGRFTTLFSYFGVLGRKHTTVGQNG
ncbi:Putative Splicing factor 3B subunit 5 [[Torrubiella] hemipterigena]|uniref:Putative Splicing factor 3B subunit 5 n=1 Tax=[Torrubiella] hemipterigena TaxID=1531966 RepID=A0A0A1TM48_9HYPO|nr:Putative Splicing factor 3B subunit 5 [[Torrubiella] hemipterigena]